MSGRGRGRGGAGRGIIKGLSFDQSIGAGEAPLEIRPSELFPPHPSLKRPRQLSERETRMVRNQKAFQKASKNGPFYTNPTKHTSGNVKIFSQDQFNDQFGSNEKADFDVFQGVETYSKMKAPPKKSLPQLSEVKFDRSNFPKELWATLEGTDGGKTKEIVRNGRARLENHLDGMGRASKKAGNNSIVDDLIKKADVDYEDEDALREAISDEEVEQDNDFGDDEEGGDYNAEGYFDDGAEDEDDGDGDDGY